jgi:YD repeat-containing protein
VIYRGPNGFELALSFNTHDLRVGRFGPRWKDSFDRRIDVVDGNMVAFRPDGRALRFVAGGGGWVADAANSDRLIELPLPTPPGPKWELHVADGDLVETYNDAGTLLSIRSRAGTTVVVGFADGTGGPNGAFFLDGNGQPTTTPLAAGTLFRFIDHFGRVIQIDRNINTLRVTRITDPAGGIYRVAYDVIGNISAITFPDTKVRQYVYNEPAHTSGATFWNTLTGIIDENGVRYSTFKYDVKERAIQTEHAGGANRYIMSYGTSTPTTVAPTSVTDPLNVARTYNFQAITGALRQTGVTGAVCPACGPESSTFDANGNPASRTDWNGNRTNYTYDLTRNLETSRTEGLTSAGAATPATRIVETQWHATFRLPTLITEKNSGGTVLRTTGMSYDTNGNVLTRTLTAGSNSRTWTYTYNANGSVLTIDGPRTDVSDVTTYAYYANDAACSGASAIGCRGQVATITNALGHVTNITEYNAHGQPLSITDPNGVTTIVAYDARQRLTSRNFGGETTTYEYDGVGQLKKVTLPDTSFLSYTYDPAHRLTEIADNLGNKIVYTLDLMGNRTQEQVRDPAGLLAQTRSRVYSNLNRLAQEISAAGHTTAYGYDNQGNLISTDGPLTGTGDTTTNTYDALNRLTRVTDPNSGQVNYGYNALDQLTSVTDPRSLATSYDYDGLNNLKQQVSPDTGTTTNTYDAAGNLLTQLDAKNQTSTYTYDALNRVTSITFADGWRRNFFYDYAEGTTGVGRLVNIEDFNELDQSVSYIAYTYDSKGRVVADERFSPDSYQKVTYRYDAFGRLAGITYPEYWNSPPETMTYGFDAAGRVNQVSITYFDWNLNPPAVATYIVVQNVQYHPFGGVKSFTYGNGQTYTRGYDQDGRIASYTLGTQSFAVGYDNASRITFINDIGNPANSNTYTYDNLDRLTNAVIPGTPFAYSYDAVGNRSSKTVGASTDTYAYGAASNRLASITPTVGPVKSYVHDANGSITNDGTLQHVYDARGRLVQTTHTAACLVSKFRINPLGQRVTKTVTRCDTGELVTGADYVYDLQGHLIAELIPGLGYRRTYVYLHDIPIGVIRTTD